MKKNKAKYLFIRLIAIFLLAFGLTSTIYALPKPTTEFYVADYARLLQQDTKDFITGINLRYEKQLEKPQVLVLTVDNLEGLDAASYAVQVFEKWGIGNKDYDNGVLILLALEERKIEVEVGYGLEGVLPDGKVGRILDMNAETLSQGDYDSGIKGIFYTIVDEINNEYKYEGLLNDYDNISSQVPHMPRNTFATNTREAMLILIVLIIIFFLGGGGRRGRTFYGGPGGFGPRGGFSSGGFGSGRGGFGGSSGGGGRSGGGGAGRGF